MSTTSTGSLSPRSARSRLDVPPVPERPEEVERALAALGLRPSRRSGQSFLVDPFLADAVAALAVDADRLPVVEIGGGLGILTAALLRRGATVTVVERDPRLAAHLRATFGSRVEVVQGDALELDLPRDRAYAGNLPFASATAILLELFRLRVPRIAAMVQAEVAARLAAGPGSKAYGRLSIVAALYGTVERYQEVPSTAFVPPPEVRAQIVTHTARTGALPVPSVERLETVVRLLFTSRRKQLGNLVPRLGVPAPDLDRAARSAGWPEDWARRRPEELAPEAFFRFVRALGEPTSPGRRPSARPA